MLRRITEKNLILTVRGVKEKKKYEEKSNVKSLFARYFGLQHKPIEISGNIEICILY